MSPAPVSRTSDTATCTTISAFRHFTLRRWLADAESLRTPARSTFVACSAGTRPNITAVTSESATLNSRTRPSSGRSSTIGMSTGSLIALAERISHHASVRPATPAALESMRLSMSSCRTSATRPAPIDSRIATS